MAKTWRMVSYDVRDAKRLRQVAKLLEGHGERLQYSVFRCHLTDREEQRLRWRLAKVMADEDDLLVIHLCDGCVSRMERRRGETGWPNAPASHRVI